ncbi:hypothetical protein V2574_05445 [Tenacibaculum maritimum]
MIAIRLLVFMGLMVKIGSIPKVVGKLKYNYDFCKKRDYLDLSLEVLKFILPELLITHFDLTKHELKGEDLHLYFEEKKAIPEEFSKDIVISHGFHKEIMVEDFPLKR